MRWWVTRPFLWVTNDATAGTNCSSTISELNGGDHCSSLAAPSCMMVSMVLEVYSVGAESVQCWCCMCTVLVLC